MKKQFGNIFAFLTITIWSSTFILSKIMLEYLTPNQILVSRYAVSVVFLSVMYPKFKWTLPKKEELLFILGGATLAGYFIFENSALKLTFSSNVSLIVATIPLMTAFIVSLIDKKNFFTKKNILGIILSYGGVVVVILSSSGFKGFEPLGDILAFGAAVMFALYSIFVDRIKGDYHIIMRTRRLFTYNLVFLFLFSFLGGKPILWETVNIDLVIGLFYLGIIASSLAFLLWNQAIDVLGTIKTNQFIYLVPVMTMLMGALILDEKITLIKLVGAGMIILGLYVTEKGEPINKEQVLVESNEF
jgi:drug/metabolite transporter (DMT)-like permease